MRGVLPPLSPYWIYRWQITMWLSSLHRITGLLLSLGAVVLSAWLIAVASGPAVYDELREIVGSAWFKPLLIGWTFAFWMAAQGSLIIYVVIIWYYARYMNNLDREYDVHEGEDE